MPLHAVHLGASSFCRYLQEALRPLAYLPASMDAPYLSAYFDWLPAGEHPSERPAVTTFKHEAKHLIDRFWPRGPAFESISADVERIQAYLADIDPSVRGIGIVACHAKGVFEPHLLSVPVPTRLIANPTPALSLLSRAIDDYPPYAIALADNRIAVVSLMNQALRDGSPSQSLGAASHSRHFEHTRVEHRLCKEYDEEIAHFMHRIAAETQRLVEESGTTQLILAGRDEVRGLLEHAFARLPNLKAQIIGTLQLDVHVTEPELIEAARPLVRRAAVNREIEAVRSLSEGLATGCAVAGADALANALQEGEIRQLVLNDDFRAAGWADYTLPVFGASAVPKEHPLGGDVSNIVPTALEEEFVRFAIRTDADIVFVRTLPEVDGSEERVPKPGAAHRRSGPAEMLDRLGGVGATLKFAA